MVTQWRNIRNMKAVITYRKGDLIFEIFHRGKSGWTVTKFSESGDRLRQIFIKGFNTKVKALAFAKAYMRKN